MDLHIGLTTSQGTIVEFDKQGLRIHESDQWSQCLLIEQVPKSWHEQWDERLKTVCKEDCWSSQHYHETAHNCYSFVLKFLVTLNYTNLSEYANSKTKFCEKFVVSKTSSAGKYISLYRKLNFYRFYIYKYKMKS